MGDRGEDMQQMTPGRTGTRVAAFRAEPIWYELYPVSQRAPPPLSCFEQRLALVIQGHGMWVSVHQ